MTSMCPRTGAANSGMREIIARKANISRGFGAVEGWCGREEGERKEIAWTPPGVDDKCRCSTTDQQSSRADDHSMILSAIYPASQKNVMKYRRNPSTDFSPNLQTSGTYIQSSASFRHCIMPSQSKIIRVRKSQRWLAKCSFGPSQGACQGAIWAREGEQCVG